MRHTDPTIPRKGRVAGNPKERQQHAEPCVGWLVDRGADGVWLVTRNGKHKSRARVASGSFGNDVEGFHRAPRPFKYDAAGTVLVQGDYFLVVYLEGDAAKPVLLGGWRPTNPADSAFFPPNPIGEDPNPARLRMAARDDSGAITGHVQATALDGGHAIELVVGGPTFGAGLRLLLDFDSGQIKLGQGTETEAVILGTSFVTAVKAMAVELQALAGLLGIPVPNTATVAAAPTVGPPYLSTIVKVQ